MKRNRNLNKILNNLVETYEESSFISQDPISIPHGFKRKEDIEIAGFIAAIFSWGQRKTIINKSAEFIHLMGDQPYDFVTQAKEKDFRSFEHFKHRTFQPDDAFSVLYFLKAVYKEFGSLEYFFTLNRHAHCKVESGLIELKNYFSRLPTTVKRSGKHISSPSTGSACKRLCMYLRWMVRSSEAKVDFDLWNALEPSDLIIPLDVHVFRAGKKLGLVKRTKPDWLAAKNLTNRLRSFDENDPVKYDFALFHIAHNNLELND